MNDTTGRIARTVALALVAACVLGCTDPEALRVRIDARTPAGMDIRRMELRAQVAGPLTGLRYRWYSVAGEVEPQESTLPSSMFTFAERATRDRVTVEVWRDGRRIARDEVDVRRDDERAQLAAPTEAGVRVEITTVPPAAPGGPDTRAAIAGRVTGPLPPGAAIAVYARAGEVWYIQPFPEARYTIGADGRWGGWTRTGSSYAAVVARAGTNLVPQYDVLPAVGLNVLARATVEGATPP